VPRLRASSDRIEFRILLDVPHRLSRIFDGSNWSTATRQAEIFVAEVAASTISVTIFTTSRCTTLEPEPEPLLIPVVEQFAERAT
jgi:hypothetical protein